MGVLGVFPMFSGHRMGEIMGNPSVFSAEDHVDSAQRAGTRDHLGHGSTTPGLHGGQDLPGQRR